MLDIEYFDAAGNASADGVFIPLSDLPGVTASELASAQPSAAKEGKAMLSLLNKIFAVTSPDLFFKLGFTPTKEAPDGVSADIFNQVFAITSQKLVNLDTDSLSVVPVPTSGANSGLGDFAITDVFAGAVKVDAAGAVAGAGIVINTSGLLPYSSLTHASINVATDGRAWFAALADHLAIDSVKRSATVASAVISGIASSLSASAIPAEYIASTDPTSGILAADVPSRGLVNRTDTFTLQLQLNQSTQTFDVLAVVA
jgi:hypothetical protein